MNILQHCSIHRGVSFGDGRFVIGLMNDELTGLRIQHSIPFYFDGETWSCPHDDSILPWLIANIAVVDEQAVIVGWGGQELSFELETLSTKRSAVLGSHRERCSIVRNVSAIGRKIYSAGMLKQVHRRNEDGSWEAIDADILDEGDQIDVGFNDIKGLSEAKVVAVGTHGMIYSYNGKKWRELDSPTNVNLNALCMLEDGSAVAVGDAGVVLRIYNETVEVRNYDFDKTIWGVDYINGGLYFLLNNGIFCQGPDQLKKIELESVSPASSVGLSVSRNRIFLFCAKAILEISDDMVTEMKLEVDESKVPEDIRILLSNDPKMYDLEFLQDHL